MKKKNEIIEAFGDAVIRVEKINGAEYHLENMILVDDFLKSKCNNFKYKKVDSEDNVFFLVL